MFKPSFSTYPIGIIPHKVDFFGCFVQKWIAIRLDFAGKRLGDEHQRTFMHDKKVMPKRYGVFLKACVMEESIHGVDYREMLLKNQVLSKPYEGFAQSGFGIEVF